METSDSSIGKLIKRKRLEKGLTLEQVAKKVGVGKSTVSKWERGAILNMKKDKLDALSLILDIDPLVFIYGNEEILNTKENEQITQEDFEKEIYTLLSKHARIKFNYSTWLFLTNKLLNNVVNLDDKQKQQIISYLELYDNGE